MHRDEDYRKKLALVLPEDRGGVLFFRERDGEEASTSPDVPSEPGTPKNRPSSTKSEHSYFETNSGRRTLVEHDIWARRPDVVMGTRINMLWERNSLLQGQGL